VKWEVRISASSLRNGKSIESLRKWRKDFLLYTQARLNLLELLCHYNLGTKGAKYNWLPRATLRLQHDAYKVPGDWDGYPLHMHHLTCHIKSHADTIIDATASIHSKNKWQYHYNNITSVQDTATVLRTAWNKIPPCTSLMA